MSPFVNIHTHKHIDNKEVIEIVNIDVDNIVNVDVSFCHSIGIHPWKVNESCNLQMQNLERLTSPTLLALGECGLDKACGSDYELQKMIFRKHIELSERSSLPLIIHSVKSHHDIISMRKETKAKMPWIFHGFQSNEQTAIQLMRHNIFLSLGEVLFKNEIRAVNLLKTIPPDRLFLETDVADRDIVDVYAKATSLSGKDVTMFRNDIFNNFVKIFGQI